MSEKLSRRDLLKLAGLGAGGFIIPPAFDNRSGSKEHPPYEIEPRYSRERVQQIDVFGGTQSIKSRESLGKLISTLERQTFAGLKIASEQVPKTLEIDRVFLPKDTRFWEFIVSKSAYDRYVENSLGIDFVTWAKLHVEKTNNMLSSAKPDIPIRIKLRRIFVLDDSLFPSEQPYWLPTHDGDNFSKWAKDIDSRWAFGPDYYNYQFGEDNHITCYSEINKCYNSGTHTEVLQNEDGSFSTVDWGLIHELTHHFDVGDLYWYPKQLHDKKYEHLPWRYKHFSFFANDIMASPRSGQISPITAMAINTRAAEGHRGVQHDGVARENPYLRFPTTSTICIKTANNQISEILKAEEIFNAEEIMPYEVCLMGPNQKICNIRPECQTVNTIKVDKNISDIGWEFSYIIIERRLGPNSFCLPFPRFYFNMAAWAGEEKPTYKINLTGRDAGYAHHLSIRVVDEKEFPTFKDNQGLVAWSGIPGTQAIAVWKLER